MAAANGVLEPCVLAAVVHVLLHGQLFYAAHALVEPVVDHVSRHTGKLNAAVNRVLCRPEAGWLEEKVLNECSGRTGGEGVSLVVGELGQTVGRRERRTHGRI